MAAFWSVVASSAQQKAPGACFSMFGIVQEAYSRVGMDARWVRGERPPLLGGIGDMRPVAQSEVCATGRFCWVIPALWLGFLYRLLGGGRFNRCCFGVCLGSHHGFGAA